MTAEVFADQERLSEITVPKKVMVWEPPHAVCRLRVCRGGDGSVLKFLKSRRISLVFVVFRDRQFAEHHSDSFRTSSL